MDVESQYWRRNLFVCLFGSFTTIAAMSMLLPFLPIYVQHLGVSDPKAVVQWSGLAFGATFLTAGLLAPVWGRLADRFGRKPILIRASLGMAIATPMIGLVQDVHQLVGLRLLTGMLGGYASGAVVMVATQTPKTHATWALGVLSMGTMAGSLMGPLIGGALPGLIGLRPTFFAAGAAIFLAFLATSFLVREEKRPRTARQPTQAGGWGAVPRRGRVLALLFSMTLLLLANMSIEPIITVYVGQIAAHGADLALIAGVVMSASALASILAAPRVGRLADRIGPARVVTGSLLAAGLLMLPQAFVTHWWQLLALRFLMGMALAGLLPAITAMLRHSVPDRVAGMVLGFGTSAQFAGQVVGPLMGGFVGAHLGLRAVFYATSLLLLAGAAMHWVLLRREAGSPGGLG